MTNKEKRKKMASASAQASAQASTQASKRAKADPLASAVRVPLNCHPRDASLIFFVRATYADFVRHVDFKGGIQEYIEDPSIRHEDGMPLSVCSRYIRWLYPKQNLDRQTLRDRRQFIELYRKGDALHSVLYFCKAQVDSVPTWAKPREIMHEKVMSFLEPQVRAFYENSISKGVRMLAAENSVLCEEVKFVIDPEDDDQKRRIQYVLQNFVGAHPKPPCPQGVRQVVFQFRPEDAEHLKRQIFGHNPIRSFADAPDLVSTLCDATKKIRFQGRLNYMDMTSIAMNFQDWEEGHLLVDELYVTLNDWRRRADYRDPDHEYLQSVSATVLVFSTAGTEFSNPQEYTDFMANLHFLSEDVRQDFP